MILKGRDITTIKYKISSSRLNQMRCNKIKCTYAIAFKVQTVQYDEKELA